MINLLVAALCCGSISFTITTTSIFKGLREFVSKFHHKLEELIHCPWCLNHYVVALYILLSGRPFHLVRFFGNEIMDFALSLFTVVGLSGLLHYVLLRAYEPVAKAAAHRELEKIKSGKK
jgi:hypothetical protein